MTNRILDCRQLGEHLQFVAYDAILKIQFYVVGFDQPYVYIVRFEVGSDKFMLTNDAFSFII